LRPAAFFDVLTNSIAESPLPCRRYRFAFVLLLSRSQSLRGSPPRSPERQLAEFLRIFWPRNAWVARPRDGRRCHTYPSSSVNVFHIVWQTLTHGIKQLKPRIEEDVKKWFSPSESHVCLPTIVPPLRKCRNRVGCWRRDCTR
jgi:hypothetical protein